MFEEGHTVCPSHRSHRLMPETVRGHGNRFRERARSFATADAD
jgi:hypothetical protein